jgi:hypothetical protein
MSLNPILGAGLRLLQMVNWWSMKGFRHALCTALEVERQAIAAVRFHPADRGA